MVVFEHNDAHQSGQNSADRIKFYVHSLQMEFCIS